MRICRKRISCNCKKDYPSIAYTSLSPTSLLKNFSYKKISSRLISLQHHRGLHQYYISEHSITARPPSATSIMFICQLQNIQPNYIHHRLLFSLYTYVIHHIISRICLISADFVELNLSENGF